MVGRREGTCAVSASAQYANALVQDVIVGPELLLDELAEEALGRSVKVLVVGHLASSFAQHLDRVAEVELDRLLREGEGLRGELLADGLDLRRELGLQAGEDVSQERIEHVDDLVVVLLKRHLAGSVATMWRGRTSRSRPVNSVMCRCVLESSARNTGPTCPVSAGHTVPELTSYTRSMSPAMHICLASCGDCARNAGRLK